MTSFKKIDEFCDRAMARMDELGDDAIQAMRNTPEAKARQAAMRARFAASEKRAAARREAGKAAAVAAASGFALGQMVRTRTGVVATVTSIDGSVIALDNGKRFAATMLTAA